MDALSLQTLGAFRFCADGRELTPPPTQKARALLVYLVLHRGVELSRESITELFWSDCTPERGRSSLNTALWSIRRALRDGGVDADAALTAKRAHVVWRLETDLDLRTFAEGAASDDVSSKRAAIALYRGEFLEGDYAEWSVAQRERAASTYDGLLADAVARDGDVASARLLIERGSFDEAPYATVAAAELDAGRRSAAAALVERYRAVLVEIGASPSAAFEAQFANVRAPAERPPDDVAIPFCGRRTELAAVARAFAQTAAGQGGVLIVHGAAGEGKTELLRHAERVAIETDVRIVPVAARADDPHSFGPWARLHEELTRTPFTAFLAAGGDATTLADALRHALGVGTALLVDDAQYLTGDALQVFVRLASGAAEGAVQLVVATRPEGLRRLMARLPHATTLELGLLSLDDLRTAIARVAPESAAALADFLFARSGGHAFFATKLFESLVRSGTLQRSRDAWVLAGKLGAEAQTPATIRDFLESRLYANGDDPATVACAFALEPDATAEDLVAVCALGEGRTFDAIDDLIGLGLLEQPASGPEFRFRHDLMREAAGRALNSGRRVQLHRAFARHFEHDERRESLVRRAAHLRASGQVLAAAHAFARAAYAVLEVNARIDALDWATAGIAVAKRLRPSEQMHRVLSELHEVATRACEEAGERTDALAHANARLAHAREAGDGVLVCRALTRRAALFLEAFPPDAALVDTDEAVELGTALNDDRLLVYGLVRQSMCRQFLGDEAGAIASARSALACAERTGSARLRATALERLLAVLCIWLHFEEATAIADRALDQARRADARTEAAVRTRRASLWYLCERFDECRRELEIVAGILESSHGTIAMPALHGISVLLLRFSYDALAANLALAGHAWEEALLIADRLLANPMSEGYSRRGIASLCRIEALLGRNERGDAEQALVAARALPLDPVAKGVVGMSLARESALAWAAVRTHAADAPQLLRDAAQALERQVRQTPLDADRAFAALAAAADEIGMEEFAAEMRERASSLRMQRLKSATARRSRNPSSASPAGIRVSAS